MKVTLVLLAASKDLLKEALLLIRMLLVVAQQFRLFGRFEAARAAHRLGDAVAVALVLHVTIFNPIFC